MYNECLEIYVNYFVTGRVVVRDQGDRRENEMEHVNQSFPILIRVESVFFREETIIRPVSANPSESREPPGRANRNLPKIRATRALMRVRSRVPTADCTRHLADAIMHAHVACGYFGRSVVACNFGLRQSYVRCIAKITDKRSPRKKKRTTGV